MWLHGGFDFLSLVGSISKMYLITEPFNQGSSYVLKNEAMHK